MPRPAARPASEAWHRRWSSLSARSMWHWHGVRSKSGSRREHLFNARPVRRQRAPAGWPKQQHHRHLLRALDDVRLERRQARDRWRHAQERSGAVTDLNAERAIGYACGLRSGVGDVRRQARFSQVTDHLPLHAFRKSVRRYDGNRCVKSFPCLSQFPCMAFAQLAHRESLRDIGRVGSVAEAQLRPIAANCGQSKKSSK